MPYAVKLCAKYRFLIYEYPFHTAKADEQIDFASHLLDALSIKRVILIGASDGIDRFVEHGNLVGLEATGQITG